MSTTIAVTQDLPKFASENLQNDRLSCFLDVPSNIVERASIVERDERSTVFEVARDKFGFQK